MGKKSAPSRPVRHDAPASESSSKGLFSRLPKRLMMLFLVLGIVFALSMYQANQPIRSVTAEVGERRIQLALGEENGVVYGIATEGDKNTRTAVAVLAADKAAQMGLPLVEEQQLREAKMTTDPATGACQFLVAPGQMIAFDPATFIWRSRSVQQ